MPIKGIIAVFMIAVAVVAICWEDFPEVLSQWFEEENE
jgi:hypothetical protein